MSLGIPRGLLQQIQPPWYEDLHGLGAFPSDASTAVRAVAYVSSFLGHVWSVTYLRVSRPRFCHCLRLCEGSLPPVATYQDQ